MAKQRRCARCRREASTDNILLPARDGKKYCTHCFYADAHKKQEEEKLRYYRDVWQWNPEQSKILIEHSLNFKWEQFYPLLNDPALHAAGVEIGARVEVHLGVGEFAGQVGNVYERIVFRRNDHDLYHNWERSVDCTHVAVNTFELNELPADQQEFAKTTENRPEIKLDPEEHFIALRSYVAGIAEIGLEAMFNLKYPNDALSLPFGFNSLMQKQILHCLKELCPHAAKSILYKTLGQLLEDAPAAWIVERWDLLSDTYGINNAFSQPEFRQSLTPDVLAKLMDVEQLRVPKVIDNRQYLDGQGWVFNPNNFDLEHHLGMPDVRREIEVEFQIPTTATPLNDGDVFTWTQNGESRQYRIRRSRIVGDITYVRGILIEENRVTNVRLPTQNETFDHQMNRIIARGTAINGVPDDGMAQLTRPQDAPDPRNRIWREMMVAAGLARIERFIIQDVIDVEEGTPLERVPNQTAMVRRARETDDNWIVFSSMYLHNTYHRGENDHVQVFHLLR